MWSESQTHLLSCETVEKKPNQTNHITKQPTKQTTKKPKTKTKREEWSGVGCHALLHMWRPSGRCKFKASGYMVSSNLGYLHPLSAPVLGSHILHFRIGDAKRTAPNAASRDRHAKEATFFIAPHPVFKGRRHFIF